MRKSLRWIASLTLALGLHPLLSSAQSLEASCNTLLTSGLRDYSVNTNSIAYSRAFFERHCEKSGEVKKSGLGIGLDTVIEDVPVDFNLNSSSSSESMKNFCKNTSNKEQRDQLDYRREETIVREAYKSFDKCILMAGSGIIVRHELRSQTDLDFFVSSNYNGRIIISGLKVPPNVVCKGQNPAAKESAGAVVFDENTTIELGPSQSLGFACTRSSRPAVDGKGDAVYDEASVTLLTNIRPDGNYSAYMPRDTKIPEMTASVLTQQMSALQQSNEELRNAFAAEKAAFLTGRTQAGAINGRHASELNVFIPFKTSDGKPVEFKTVPEVVATVDKGSAQPQIYWTVNVISATTKGFNARVFSVEKVGEPNYGWSGDVFIQWMAHAIPAL